MMVLSFPEDQGGNVVLVPRGAYEGFTEMDGRKVGETEKRPIDEKKSFNPCRNEEPRRNRRGTKMVE